MRDKVGVAGRGQQEEALDTRPRSVDFTPMQQSSGDRGSRRTHMSACVGRQVGLRVCARVKGRGMGREGHVLHGAGTDV